MDSSSDVLILLITLVLSGSRRVPSPPPSPQVCVYSKGRLGPLVSTDLYPGERDQDVTLVTEEVTLQSEIRNLGGLVGCTCTLSQQERQKQAPTAYH